MTKEFGSLPEYVSPIFGNVAGDAKYFLSLKKARGLLLFGAILSSFAILLPLVLADAFIVAFADENWIYTPALQSSMMFFSIVLGLLFVFPGVYCGMYRVLLKRSAGEEASVSDLLFYYTTPKLYFRSIKIFIYGGWYVVGFFLYLTLMQIISGVLTTVTDENVILEYAGLMTLIMLAYLIAGTGLMYVRRKYVFVFVPYAVENTHLSIVSCGYTAKQVRSNALSRALPGNFFITLSLVLASFLTIGILFILYVAPLMVSQKVSFYRDCMVKKPTINEN